MYLNVYQPKLQYASGIVGYLRERLGMSSSHCSSFSGLARLPGERAPYRMSGIAFCPGQLAWNVPLRSFWFKTDVSAELIQRFEGSLSQTPPGCFSEGKVSCLRLPLLRGLVDRLATSRCVWDTVALRGSVV